MEVSANISSLREFLRPFRAEQKTIALVPTMGNLHAGHLELVRAAKTRADIVVVSLFVNPLQFGPDEDLESYPRTLDSDKEVLKLHECDCLFIPETDELYPEGLSSQTQIQVPALANHLCGASRPGHFEGVATVVSKLFNIVLPNFAVFGLKDYQQFLVIKKLVMDLAFDIEIIGIEIVREVDGLAMSSRNRYLNTEQRSSASRLHGTLNLAKQAILDGERNFARLENESISHLAKTGLQPDYFAVCDASNLQPPSAETKRIAILAAAFLGSTRLIDNIRFPIS